MVADSFNTSTQEAYKFKFNMGYIVKSYLTNYPHPNRQERQGKEKHLPIPLQ